MIRRRNLLHLEIIDSWTNTQTKEITIGEDVIQRSEIIKLFWVKLDKTLSFKGHIMEKCRK